MYNNMMEILKKFGHTLRTGLILNVVQVIFNKIQNVSPYFIIVQIIFHFLWDHWAHCGIFENRVLLMYTLEGISSVANFITAYEASQ